MPHSSPGIPAVLPSTAWTGRRPELGHEPGGDLNSLVIRQINQQSKSSPAAENAYTRVTKGAKTRFTAFCKDKPPRRATAPRVAAAAHCQTASVPLAHRHPPPLCASPGGSRQNPRPCTSTHPPSPGRAVSAGSLCAARTAPTPSPCGQSPPRDARTPSR